MISESGKKEMNWNIFLHNNVDGREEKKAREHVFIGVLIYHYAVNLRFGGRLQCREKWDRKKNYFEKFSANFFYYVNFFQSILLNKIDFQVKWRIFYEICQVDLKGKIKFDGTIFFE